MHALTGLSGLSGMVPSGSTTVLQDNFVDTNGTSLAAHTMNVGPGWTISSGTWTIQSNAAENTAGTSTIVTSDSGQSNVTISATVTIPTSATGSYGLAARYTDTSNQWRIGVTLGSSGNFTITEDAAGTVTTRATGSVTINANTAYTVQAVMSGTTITATVNGGNQISYGSASSNQSATKHGLRSGGSVYSIYGSFLVTNP
jgi:hypothetical protein